MAGAERAEAGAEQEKFMWTDRQKLAIEMRDRNMLVAAAAGSGKTSVLVERIKQLILQEHVSIDRMLVVTFTKAAASEMREKIIAAINKQLEEERDSEVQGFLTQQLNLVYEANISTFHSFALEVIRRFFYLTDLTPDLKICDDGQGALLKGEALDEVFQLAFAEDFPGFSDFLTHYAKAKNEENVRNMILSMHSSLMSNVDPWSWLDQAVESLNQDGEEFSKSPAFEELKKETISGLRKSLRWFDLAQSELDAAGTVKVADKNLADTSMVQGLLELAEHWDADTFDKLHYRLNDYTFMRMNIPKEEKDAYSMIQGEVERYRKRGKRACEDLKARYFMLPLEDQLEEMHKTYGYAKRLAQLVKEFHRIFSEKKREKKLIDFSDIEHIAIEILKHREVAEEYREKFDYIFVDEYQDSNQIQDTLIAAVKRENNLFMVGDVKQSIYKFRLAEPEIFMEKYRLYQASNPGAATVAETGSGAVVADSVAATATAPAAETAAGTGTAAVAETGSGTETGSGAVVADSGTETGFGAVVADSETENAPTPAGINARIDLNANFRSKPEVVKSVNDVFSVIMEGYDQDAALVEGNPYKGEFNYPTELHLLNLTPAEGKEEEIDEEIQDLLAAEKEGYIAAKLIQENLGKKIYDVKKGVERELRLRDMVILLRSQKNYADKIQKALLDKGIPSHIAENDGYFDTVEIQVFMNLLSVIDNRKQDLELISALHSSIFGLDLSQLAKIRIASPKTSYFKALERCAAGEAGAEPQLREKCAEVMDKLAQWHRLSLYMGLADFIWKVMEETGYYAYVGMLPNGKQRQANLRALVDKAVAYEGSQLRGLYGFINYVAAIKDKKVKMGQVSLVGEEDNVVRIMTVHKSKGLEYPYVIVGGLCKDLTRTGGEKIPLSMHKDLGLALTYVNREEHYHRDTLLQRIIDRRLARESKEEEIRILYVAFTRAQDQLVLLGSTKKMDKYLEEKYEPFKNDAPASGEMVDVDSAKTFMDMLLQVSARGKLKLCEHSLEEIETSGSESKGRREAWKQLAETIESGARPAGPDFEEIDRKLSYSYEEDKGSFMKSKYSVSELNSRGGNLTAEDEREFRRRFYENLVEKGLGGPLLLEEEKLQFTSAEIGTLVHALLEHWDFRSWKPEAGLAEPGCVAAQAGAGKEAAPAAATQETLREKVEKLAEELCQKGVFSKAEAEAAAKNAHMVSGFLLSPMGRRMAEAENLHREKPFTLLHELQGQKVMVQGVVDCFFKEGDSYVLLDYKTGSIRPGAPEAEVREKAEHYREQIELYKKAVEKSTGLPVKEAYIAFLDSDQLVAM